MLAFHTIFIGRHQPVIAGERQPLADIDVIHTELGLADLETVEKGINRVSKVAKSGDKEAKAKLAVFESVREHLDAGRLVIGMDLDEDQREADRDHEVAASRLLLLVIKVDLEVLGLDGLEVEGVVLDLIAAEVLSVAWGNDQAIERKESS